MPRIWGVSLCNHGVRHAPYASARTGPQLNPAVAACALHLRDLELSAMVLASEHLLERAAAHRGRSEGRRKRLRPIRALHMLCGLRVPRHLVSTFWMPPPRAGRAPGPAITPVPGLAG